MAGCKREVMEPSGREKVAAAAALVAGLVGMWFMLAYSYVYINCAVFPGAVPLRQDGGQGLNHRLIGVNIGPHCR